MSINFTLKVTRVREGDTPFNTKLYACRSVEVDRDLDDGVTVRALGLSGNPEDAWLHIPARSQEPQPGDCREIIVENMAGRTVERWVYKGEKNLAAVYQCDRHLEHLANEVDPAEKHSAAL